MVISTKLKYLRTKAGWTQDQLAKKLDVTKGQISHYERGENAPPLEMLRNIAKLYQVDLGVLTDDSASINTEVSNAKMVDFSGPKNNLTIVPLKAFGGFLSGYANKVFMESLEKMPFSFVKGECFAFEVEGFSMMPDYLPGSYVVCTEVEKMEWLNKNKDYVFQTVDGIILKRFLKIDGNYCHLTSINKDYDHLKPMHMKGIKKVYFVEYKISKP